MSNRPPSDEAVQAPEPELARARAEAALRVEKARKRLARRVDAIGADLARGALAQAAAAEARWFVAAAARAPRGTRALTVTDWSTGAAVERTFACDPSKLPRDAIEAVFARARRLLRGQPIAEARLQETRAKIASLDATLRAIQSAPTPAAIDEALAPHRAAPLPASVRRVLRDEKPGRGGRVPHRTFLSSPGVPIYVGRGAADNDALTFRVARPRDLWLHARGATGAHVILPLTKGKEPSSEALVDAGHLAAHFSDRRGEALVEITYAARGRIRKPRGSPPGLVVVDQGKTMLVRVEPERIKRLLASEEGAT